MPAESSFVPRLDVLPPAQRRLWDELGAIPTEFVLYGGTALALHLGHRQSVDFDFFGDRAFQPGELTTTLAFLSSATITQQAPNTLSVTVDRGGPVRLSFFGAPAIRRLCPPLITPGNSVQVASLLDIAGTKASVVQQRAEAKDYVDIDAILRDGHIDLPNALAAARAIYGAQFNPLITLKALSFFDDGDLGSLPRDVRDRLVKAATEVDLARIPVIEADRPRRPNRPAT
jgi:Nucleotidyl transferase AbiEii toxin, Type IV TA system